MSGGNKDLSNKNRYYFHLVTTALHTIPKTCVASGKDIIGIVTQHWASPDRQSCEKSTTKNKRKTTKKNRIMYGKSKNSTVPSDSQAREKYVYIVFVMHF